MNGGNKLIKEGDERHSSPLLKNKWVRILKKMYLFDDILFKVTVVLFLTIANKQIRYKCYICNKSQHLCLKYLLSHLIIPRN